jgi:DUF1680 family protein
MTGVSVRPFTRRRHSTILIYPSGIGHPSIRLGKDRETFNIYTHNPGIVVVNVVEASSSPFAVMRPIPIERVLVTGGFWEMWLGGTLRSALLHQYQMLEESDRINRFRWASGRTLERPSRSLYPFDDSDLYKWLEACGFYLARSGDAEIRGLVEGVIGDVVSAQEPDGYLFTEHHGQRSKRWRNLTFDHELYCAGHLIQAAIALHRSIGETRLFSASLKFADLINETFGPDGIAGVCGHPEIEMALVELYRETGESKYLRKAAFFVDERGKGRLRPDAEDKLSSTLYQLYGGPEYFVDHAPVRELAEIAGHAVRSLYLNCGVTDLYLETGEKELLMVMERVWRNFVERKMYVTGAAGSRYVSESFGVDYELPNERAYAETCAGVASFMWNWRMLLSTGEARFTDVMELALYNAVLPGISLDGSCYFYMNPLESSGGYSRDPWFRCACCPPNVARLLASLPGYLYGASGRGVWIHLYCSSRASIPLDGTTVKITQETDYPWSGLVRITVEPEQPSTFSLFLRIPGWSSGGVIKFDGRVFRPRGPYYLEVRRRWRGSDLVKLALPVGPRLVTSHHYVRNNVSKVAIRRGPLIYCLESVDNPVDPRDIFLTREAKIREKPRRDLLGGLVTLEIDARSAGRGMMSRSLYTTLDEYPVGLKRVKAVAIPYYAWANRGESRMVVWIPVTDLYGRRTASASSIRPNSRRRSRGS